MKRLQAFSLAEIARSLQRGTFRLAIGPVILRIESGLPEIRQALCDLYAHYPASVTGGYYDYDISIEPAAFGRRWWRRNATFVVSGERPFLPMRVEHAHAMFEWGVNWLMGSSSHQFLVLHAAVLAKGSHAVLLPAASGHGKSTLAAELVMRGWRLLSDEMALIRADLQLVPLPRPISLKNQSIDLIKARHPSAIIGPKARDTLKGTVAHMRVPESSLVLAHQTATPALIVFPRWQAGSERSLTPIGQGQAALRLIAQAFNYGILGKEGFDRLCRLVRQAPAWQLDYASLDVAAATVESMLLSHA